MGTTSQKLTYLNDTKGLLKDRINSLGGNITSQTTFRNYATELDNIYDELPKVSGTGTSINLTPTLKGRITSQMNGDTEQQSYSGKNLLPNNATSQTINGITYTINEDKTITANGTATAHSVLNIYNTSLVLQPGTYMFSGCPKNGSWGTYSMGYGTYNDSGNGAIINTTEAFSGVPYIRIANGTTVNNLVFKPMIEIGNTITNYEPYVGGVSSPNPDYPQEIKSVTGLQKVSVCGKNLFDYTKISNAPIWTEWASSGGRQLEFKVKPNTQYTLSSNVPQGSSTLLYFNGDSTATNGVWVNNPKTMTSNSNGILYVYFFNNRDYYSDIANGTYYIQLEVGTEATEYEPYQGQTKELNLGKNLFDKSNTNKLDGYINSTGIITSEATNKTIYIPCKSSTTYTVSKIASARFEIASYSSTPQIGSTTSNFIRDNSATHLTLTTGSSDTYLAVWYYNHYNDTLTEQQILDTIQIEKGSTATTYAPYFTPIELNKIGTYQDSIKKSTGKNLFDKNGQITLGARLAANGTEYYSDASNYYISDWIKIQSNTTYTKNSPTADAYHRVCFYASNSVNDFINYSENNTFTTPATAVYLRFCGLQTELNTTQIEEGQATSYEPYLPKGTWYIEKQTDKIILNGSESWGASKISGTVITSRYRLADNVILPSISYLSYCDKFINRTSSMSAGDYECVFINNNTIYISINIDRLSVDSWSEFKTWLTTHNTLVYYVLKSPTYTTITNKEQLGLDEIENMSSYKGETNIAIMSENLPTIMNASAIKGDA